MSKLSSDHSVQDRPSRRGPRWRRWLAVAITSTVALAAVLVVMVLGDEPRDEDEPEATSSEAVAETTPSDARTSAEATALAEAYIDARNAYDSDQARALVAENFWTTEHPDGYHDGDTMEQAFENFEAYGFDYANVECRPTESTPRLVRCDFDWITELHRIGDHEPTAAWLLVKVEDGRIVRIDRGDGDHVDWWDPFMNFLTAEHPAFAGQVERALDLEPTAHRQVMDDLSRYLTLYAESLADESD